MSVDRSGAACWADENPATNGPAAARPPGGIRFALIEQASSPACFVGGHGTPQAGDYEDSIAVPSPAGFSPTAMRPTAATMGAPCGCWRSAIQSRDQALPERRYVEREYVEPLRLRLTVTTANPYGAIDPGRAVPWGYGGGRWRAPYTDTTVRRSMCGYRGRQRRFGTGPATRAFPHETGARWNAGRSGLAIQHAGACRGCRRCVAASSHDRQDDRVSLLGFSTSNTVKEARRSIGPRARQQDVGAHRKPERNADRHYLMSTPTTARITIRARQQTQSSLRISPLRCGETKNLPTIAARRAGSCSSRATSRYGRDEHFLARKASALELWR